VPGRYVYLDALPLTLSSKVDLAALRALAPAEPEAARPATEWSSDVGRAVAAVWSRILGERATAAEDDFVGRGGTSLAAMRLAGTLRLELGREIGVADVFRAGSLGALVTTVEAAPALATAEPAAPPAKALTAAQRRLWFIDRLTGHTPAYHIAIADRLHG